MDNRLLCKAKDLSNGNWIIGFYSSQLIKHIGKNIEWKRVHSLVTHSEDQSEQNYYEIDPKTICQCTGIKDDKKQWVFEGDYFWHEIEEGLIGLVVWDSDELRWNVAIVPNIKANKCVPDFNNNLEWWELWEYDSLEIIGNKLDRLNS